MKAIRRCPHVVMLESRINVYCTQDGTQVELCEDCTADLLDALIVQITTEKFDEWQKEAEETSPK